jgi:hypothetical protein
MLSTVRSLLPRVRITHEYFEGVFQTFLQVEDYKGSIELWYVGFEVFTAVVMKSIIFWDMTPYSPSSFNRHFGGKYRLHLLGGRNKFSKNQLASRWQAAESPVC